MTQRTLAAVTSGAILFASTLAGTPLAAQSTTMQQPVARSPSAQSVAAPEVRDQERVTCKGIQVHYTLLGIAFDCVDFQAGTSLVIVIDDGKFPGGGAAMVPVLDRLSVASRSYIQNPQNAGIRLIVRHRPASPASVSVCTIMQRRSPGNRDCREAVYFHE